MLVEYTIYMRNDNIKPKCTVDTQFIYILCIYIRFKFFPIYRSFIQIMCVKREDDCTANIYKWKYL